MGSDDNPGQGDPHDPGHYASILEAMEHAMGDEYRPGRHHPTHEDDTRRTFDAYQDQDLANRSHLQATMAQHLSNAMVASHYANMAGLRHAGINFERQTNTFDAISAMEAGLPVPLAAIAAGIAKAMEEHNAAHHQ